MVGEQTSALSCGLWSWSLKYIYLPPPSHRLGHPVSNLSVRLPDRFYINLYTHTHSYCRYIIIIIVCDLLEYRRLRPSSELCRRFCIITIQLPKSYYCTLLLSQHLNQNNSWSIMIKYVYVVDYNIVCIQCTYMLNISRYLSQNCGFSHISSYVILFFSLQYKFHNY